VTASVHEAAAGGFGAAAEEYERARPDYPVEAVDRLIRELELGPAGQAMDLGAGTGKLTRMLARTGARLVAVEPVEPMWKRFASVLPDTPLVAGVAESLPFGNESFDAIVCAQAFHWFDADVALPEIHRVLKHGGRVGLLWNVRDESVGWVRALSEILEPYQRAVPNESSGEWRRAVSASDLFDNLHQRRFRHAQPLDAGLLVTRYASASYVAVLPEDERADVLERIRRLGRTHPELAGRERFDLPYVTELYWCARA